VGDGVVNVDVELLLGWRTLLVALGLVAFLPGVALRQFVRLYPRGHERRRELVADLYVRPFHERLPYVVQCLEVSFAEGLSARWRSRRTRGIEPDAEAIRQSDPDRTIRLFVEGRSDALIVANLIKFVLKDLRPLALSGHEVVQGLDDQPASPGVAPQPGMATPLTARQPVHGRDRTARSTPTYRQQPVSSP
jgi:hypothetical protein